MSGKAARLGGCVNATVPGRTTDVTFLERQVSGQRAAWRRKCESRGKRIIAYRPKRGPQGRLREKSNRAIIADVTPIQVLRLSDERSEPDSSILRWPGLGSEAGARSDFVVGFDRRELQAIFNVYGRMVAQGVWRDYAMDFMPTRAVFSIFRHTGEAAYYRIVKEPKAARKHGTYSILMPTGLVVKRGSELARLLAVLEKKPRLVSL